MTATWWTDAVAAARTDAERAFLAALPGVRLGLDLWLHEDLDGRPWLIVSRDFLVGNAIRATLRVDFDGDSLRGGWSPACLNWDSGVRADAAGIDTAAPDGLAVDSSDPAHLAALTATWFDHHIDIC